MGTEVPDPTAPDRICDVVSLQRSDNAGVRRRRLSALRIALSDAVVMFESRPTPHERSPTGVAVTATRNHKRSSNRGSGSSRNAAPGAPNRKPSTTPAHTSPSTSRPTTNIPTADSATAPQPTSPTPGVEPKTYKPERPQPTTATGSTSGSVSLVGVDHGSSRGTHGVLEHRDAASAVLCGARCDSDRRARWPCRLYVDRGSLHHPLTRRVCLREWGHQHRSGPRL